MAQNMRIFVIMLSALFLGAGLHAHEGDAEQHLFRVERFGGTFRHPWSIAALPDGGFLVSERDGQLWRVNADARQEIVGVPEVAAVGQGGLLDIEVSHDFATTRQIFFSYSASVGEQQYTTVIAKAVLERNALSAVETIFTGNNAHDSGRHFGSRITKLADGTLLFSMGDRGRRDDAQNSTRHAGSILRIDKNGAAPADNPFVYNAAFAPEIFSIGHRNIQGMAVDGAGNIFAHEHGPMGGDELNRIVGGKNYGWPIVSHGKEYFSRKDIGEGSAAPGYERPLRHWTPSIAPSGMMIYSGRLFPEWAGDFFLGALAGKHMVRLTLANGAVVNEEKLFENTYGRIRDIKEDSNGIIYFITDEKRGGIYRIVR